MRSFCTAKATHIFFSKKFQHIWTSLNVNVNESLTNHVVSFEQLGPVRYVHEYLKSTKEEIKIRRKRRPPSKDTSNLYFQGTGGTACTSSSRKQFEGLWMAWQIISLKRTKKKRHSLSLQLYSQIQVSDAENYTLSVIFFIDPLYALLKLIPIQLQTGPVWQIWTTKGAF